MHNTPPASDDLPDAAGDEAAATPADDISAQAGDPNFMASLARGLAVIEAFSPQRRQMSISQISQKTGIPRAAVRRCLYTLAKLGFVSAEDGRNFALRPRILSLGHAYLASTPLAKAAQPVLRDVSNRLHESSSIAILDGDEILYIARASTSRIMTIDLDIGSRLPAVYTSMGRVLLAHLPEDEREACLGRAKLIQYTAHTLMTVEALRAELARVRAQGYAVIDQELELGLRSIAVPIAAPDGKVVAAINVGLQAARVSVAEMEAHILPVLRDAAAELALLLA
ncbi:IclR family transcriptional regulator C-terminal domain-containing protein [Oryzomicrobium sp.]|uniref:IclR family transcriptional regulator domain-containing protein n=1 Tax=Oryzomicrobium sp. TaxID=1911578 RepID=UPI0025CFCDAF|nr:IclR family transcriptional regulator C-terminal domain-containing protein [Oryzomicrobium sp.]MCE1244520.1 helix-turn-helix domain-containing protein [Oryzomicrobium sp.]